MRKQHFLKLASLLIAAALFVVGSSFDASAAKNCITIGQKSICFDDAKGQKNNGGNNPAEQNGGGDQGNGGGGGDQGNGGGGGGNQGNDATPKALSKPFDCSKAQCDAGEVKLDKPNKYHACCEPTEGFCPPDRPSGTPPNCCAEGTTFREGACWPTNCPSGTVGTPPHCQRTCDPGKILVESECYDPCPAGTLGSPPNCTCPAGQDWDAGDKACKERPKCTGGMVGTPPNCACPPKTVLQDGTCQKCTGGRVAKNGQCECPSGTEFIHEDEKCRPCEGDKEVIKGACQCRFGTMEFPDYSDRCVKGRQLRCLWRGTAPFCDGECVAGEVEKDRSPDQNHASPQNFGFGSSCESGEKAYCCRPGW